VRFLHAVHDLEDGQVEIVLAAHAAEHGMHDAGGAMHIEAQFHQPVNHRLDLRLRRALLHYDNHWLFTFRAARFRVRGFHSQSLYGPHLVDDAFENAANGVHGDRALIGADHVGENLVFPFRARKSASWLLA